MDGDRPGEDDAAFLDRPEFGERADRPGPKEPPRPASLVDRFKEEEDLLDRPGLRPEAPLYDVLAREATPSALRRRPWCLDVFCYPCNRAGLFTMALIFGLPITLIALCLAAFQWMPGVPILIFILVPLVMGTAATTLGMVLYFNWYICVCVRESAVGELRAPETLGQTPGLMELAGQFFQVGLSVIFFPGLFASLSYGLSLGPVGTSLLGGILFFGCPLCLLSVISNESISGMNPLLLLRNLIRVLPAYCRLLILLALLHGPILLGAWWLCSRQPEMQALWIALGTAAEIYLLLVSAHLLGRFNWRYRDRLDW